ncbi:sensor histidine kinase [Paenibacillus contaminans]|uniref:histidine kinase n=1 Tax=Paenibacillus contaminans TaxID=450362 RepID=A0A329MQF3_9BACL|nr:sensor histidine kinase [Paenibacillus contaminans]RAV22004.1 two-component sensor histidine kinase [Paenibacillus contaminans]
MKRLFLQSTQVRLTSYFLLILVPLVAISLYGMYKSQTILEKQVNEQMNSAMQTAMAYIDQTVNGISELSILFSTDPSLNQNLLYEGNELTNAAMLDFQKVLAQISNVNGINAFISHVDIYHGASGMMVSSKIGGRTNLDYREQTWYRQAVENKSGLLFYLSREEAGMTPDDSLFSEDDAYMVRIMNMFGSDKSNVLIMAIKKNELLSLVKNLLQTEGDRVHLFDKAGRLVVSSADRSSLEDKKTNAEQRFSNVSVDGVPYIAATVKGANSGWMLELERPRAAIYTQTDKLRLFIYWIIVVSILLTLVISWVVYRGIASPLSALAHGMKQIRLGNLNAKLAEGRKDEFGFLTRSFNEMAKEQKHLIKNIYEQQLMRAQSELRFLQSQINPHFLYNTLDAIYWTAKNYAAHEISDMVYNLSKFFRLSLSKGREMLTIAETVEHLQYYLRVQQLRYMDIFEVKFEVASECRELPILKLLLQPLVENAILHGLEKKQGDGLLTIICALQDDMVVIEVRDNGKGMPPERLEKLREQLQSLDADTLLAVSEAKTAAKSSYGLWNVKARLKLHYGSRTDMKIDSRENEGTSVTIRIPIGGRDDEPVDSGR